MRTRLLMFTSFFLLLSACTGGSNSAGADGSTRPAGKSDTFVNKSAADLRRDIAGVTVEGKKFLKSTDVPSQLYYTCDRETLPRTCCYYLMNGGGGVFGGSPSCTEENH